MRRSFYPEFHSIYQIVMVVLDVYNIKNMVATLVNANKVKVQMFTTRPQASFHYRIAPAPGHHCEVTAGKNKRERR